MAPKRQRGEGSSNVAAHDSTRFVSTEASKRFDEGRTKKKPVSERGFQVPMRRYPWLDTAIEERGWKKFYSHSGPANITVVREFYANAYERQGYSVMVRGKMVSFRRATINKYYGVPNIDNDPYHAGLANPDYEELLETVGGPGAVWITNVGGKPKAIATKEIQPEGRVWFHFLTRKLIPGSHIATVTKDRVILLAAIMKGVPIDIGRVIRASIIQTISAARGGLFFPSLITALCVKAKVPVVDSDEIKQPMQPLLPQFIDKLLAGELDLPEQPRAAPEPRLTMPQRMHQLEQKVDSLGTRLEYQISCSQAISEMMHRMASHLQLDMTRFPNLPPEPAPSVPTPFVPEGEDGGNGTTAHEEPSGDQDEDIFA